MKLARVVGTVVATIQHPLFDGRRLLLCDLLDAGGAPTDGYTIAVDTVGAGAGETVLVLDEGTSARQIVGVKAGPIRAVVVGIVDAIDTGPAGAPAPTGAAVARPRRSRRSRTRSA